MSLTQRQTTLLNDCLTPRTISELARMYDCSYHTIRNDVIDLCKQFLLKKSLFPSHGHYTYQTAFKSDETGQGVEHLNLSFRGITYSPVEVMNNSEFIEGTTRATRLLQLTIAKLLIEYDVGSEEKPKNPNKEVFQPHSDMVQTRLEKASEYLREVANLIDQIRSNIIWENKDFIRLFYGRQKYNKEQLRGMIDELMTEAEKWPEFREYLNKVGQ